MAIEAWLEGGPLERGANPVTLCFVRSAPELLRPIPERVSPKKAFPHDSPVRIRVPTAHHSFGRIPKRVQLLLATDIRAGDVGSLTEECDRRQEDTSAIRYAWRGPVDRTWAPVRDHPPTPFGRVFTCLYREGRRGIVREPEGIETPPPAIFSEMTWSKG